MFFKYTHEMSLDTAHKVAKLGRANLVTTLIKAYKDISEMNQGAAKTPELTRFLSGLLQKIEEFNQCKNKTEHFETTLKDRLEALANHPQHAQIAVEYNRCVAALAKEAREAQDRDRYATENKLTAIKNNAVYTAAIPSIGAIVGGVLLVFYPVGLTVLVASGVALILSEVIFWAQKYRDYQALNTNLRDMTLETDYAEGLAVPLEDLPKDPKSAKTAQNSPKPAGKSDGKPVLINEETDKAVQAFIEGSTDIIMEVTANASASMYALWSNVTEAIGSKPLPAAVGGHLHNV